MRVSLKWLADYVDLLLPTKELAHRLTMAGNEVDAILSTGGDWDLISVAQVTAVERHPNAERLTLTTVDLGGGERCPSQKRPRLHEVAPGQATIGRTVAVVAHDSASFSVTTGSSR